jgi:catechol 2,3-dioxygenase-like lactoylglutathione lyase family enzyme
MSHDPMPTSIYGRFYQLGYVARDIDAAVAHLQARMGARLTDLTHDVRGADGEPTPLQNLAHMVVPGAELEIIQPRDDMPSIYHETLPLQGDFVRLHHLGFLVDNEEAWQQAFSALDVMQTPVALMFDTPQVRCAYLDTRSQVGHYSELVLRKPGGTFRPLP